MIDTRKGFALVYFLLISLIIVMMTGAVLTMGHEGLAATRRQGGSLLCRWIKPVRP